MDEAKNKPSDTFGEVVRWLENKAAECRSSAKAASTPSIDEEVVEMMAMLRASYAEEADRIAQAARLLEAAGSYAKASHGCLTDAALTTLQYNAERRALAAGSLMPDDYNVMDEYSNARAALDALAPEMKEVGR